jgi:DNA ligase-1
MYKPMLAPNEAIDVNTLQYPLLASFKLDGIRCIFKDGEMLSRSLKQIPNVQLHRRFADIKKWSAENPGHILDGEIYAHGLTFQEITSVVMSDDKEVPDGFWFYCFDYVTDPAVPFAKRNAEIKQFENKFFAIAVLQQHEVKAADGVMYGFYAAEKQGYEGLILKNPNGRYKFGRATVKENLMYKVKPFVEKSAIIKDVQQATVAREGSERKINELGQSKTSMKKDDRVPIERAAAFIVDWNGRELAVTIAATNEEKDKIWATRAEYVGKELCFKAMDVGAKDLPRHPVATRWWLKNE